MTVNAPVICRRTHPKKYTVPVVTHITSNMSETEPDEGAHLAAVEDGCGCAEVWEHLSEQREE
jgi:hypothetical protein